MKIQPSSLFFEVTRRCNMNCEHCLRGDAQCKDMDKVIVDKTLDHVSRIDTLVLTGGEPTLNLDLCRYIFEEIQRRRIPLGEFFIATNGKDHQMELTKLLLEILPYVENLDLCGVSISTDVFHDPISPSPVKYLSIYQNWKENGDYRNYTGLLKRGRAAENYGDYATERSISMDLYPADSYDETIQLEGDLYITAEGLICADCDLPYDLQETCKVGDVDQFDRLLEQLWKEVNA